ncbi:MAG: TIGR04255 family protein [Dehalococcoidia bacterium]
MAKPRHLEKAPITEAVIDFRANLTRDFNLDKISSLKEELFNEYPNCKPIKVNEFIFGLEGDQPIKKNLEQLVGYRLETQDGKNVAQFRLDGFTFSRLAPYTEWKKVFGEARRLWEIYVAKASPESVTRIATRYINQLRLPFSTSDFSQYLTVPPIIPDTLPRITNFLIRVSICEPASDIKANITQAFQMGTDPSDHVIIILDIDAFKTGSFVVTESGMWDTFEALRNMKNRIFFEMITEDTARLYEV